MKVLEAKLVNTVIEISPVMIETADSVTVVDDIDLADFYSVYIRKTNGEAFCLADFDSYSEAKLFVEQFPIDCICESESVRKL